MKKTKIYTKTGDTGETGLVSGNRVSKAELRLEIYGEMDELNSRLGFSISLLIQDAFFTSTVQYLQKIQSALFDLGSNMACEASFRAQFKLPQLTMAFIESMESEIDRMDADLLPLKNFILPGGTLPASSLHLCRTSARNVERKLVHFFSVTQEELPTFSTMFLNRLSDYLFVLARYVNHYQKGQEIFWKPN